MASSTTKLVILDQPSN
jgi:hypothetical protein